MARKRGGSRKRAGSGKGPQRSFAKKISLDSIGAAVLGKLFNRDEKEVEDIAGGGGRFGKDEEKLLEELVGGTPDEAKAQIEEAYGGTPAGAKAQIERAYGEDSLKQEMDAKLKSLEEKLAAANEELRLEQRRRDTPEQRAGEQPGPPLGAEEVPDPVPDPVGAHQFGGALPRGGPLDDYVDRIEGKGKRMPPGQGVMASEDPLARGIGEGRPAGPFDPYLDRMSGGSSGGARMGPGQGVMAPQGPPLGALTPDRPQTGQGQTEKERFIARAMAGGAERPQTLPLPTGRMPAGQGVMAPEAAREAMHMGGTPGGIAGEPHRPGRFDAAQAPSSTYQDRGEPLGVEPGLRGGETATVSGLTPRDRPAPSRPSLSIEDTMGRREGSRRDRRRSRAEESVGDPALDFGDLDPLKRTHTPEKTRGGKKKAAGSGGLTNGFVALPKTKKSGETTKEYNNRKREALDKNEARKAEILRDDSLSDEEAAVQWLSEGLTGTINAEYNGRRITVKDGKLIRGKEFASGIREDALYFVDAEEEMGADSWFD